MMENNKCVYLHKDCDGIVRYVGSGTESRAYTTYANSGRGEKYAKCVESNGKLEVEIVAEGLSKVVAEDLERELFDKYEETILNINRPSSAKEMRKDMFLKHLYYDETSPSCLRWKTDRIGANNAVRIKADSEAGSLSKSKGYYEVGLYNKLYYAHRIIAVLHDININDKVIDHIDRNRTNNKISNLRVVSQKENCQNSSQHKLSSANTSGAQGVSYDKRGYWIAYWYENGKKHKYFSIKNYASSEEAYNAAVEYRNQMIKIHYLN